ncbi:MAG: family 10 glycosylhydrolase [Anaerovoracaceae bacterium]
MAKKIRKINKEKKRLIIVMAFLAFLATILIVVGLHNIQQKVEMPKEVRGIWVAYLDYKELGLYNKSEKEFKKNMEDFLEKAKEKDINTVYFHVRAFDDAVYKSNEFPLSREIWDRKEEIPYDPLETAIEIVHKDGMQIHAWMNPYRITVDYFLDPALDTSTQRIVDEVKEIMEYDVDGIHFDDYFYNAAKGYKDVDGKKSISVKDEPSDQEKKSNVNQMISQVYKTVKTIDKKKSFGISPQGNMGNCRSIGADIDTWLTEDGYVDYIVPQIYWTDNHTAKWRPKMFTDTLIEWQSINALEKPIYPGLALYRTGITASDDLGWGKQDNNLQLQVEKLREAGCKGYVLFSARDLYLKHSKKELDNLK